MFAAQLDNLSKRYGQRWALVRLNLAIPEHKAVLLTGPNGAGKTTLLRVMATALKPTRGELKLFGQPAHPNTEAVRPDIGIATHQNHLYADLSALENLQLVARFNREIDRKKIGEVLERVGLAARAHSPVRTFSAGMKRRLCFARVLLRKPRLVLLDEPYTQLDPEGVRLIDEVIHELRAQQVTLVMSTHDVERGMAICDLHLELVAGRITRNLEPIVKPAASLS